MARLKRKANWGRRRPPKPGWSCWRCSSTLQKRSWAIWAGRSRLAVERPFLLGGLAPRKAESGPEFSRKASQTSLRPRAWVSWAKIRLTTWLHGVKLRDFSATPVSRASWGTRCAGIRLQSWRRRVKLLRVGLRSVCFFIPDLVAGFKPAGQLFFYLTKPSKLGDSCERIPAGAAPAGGSIPFARVAQRRGTT